MNARTRIQLLFDNNVGEYQTRIQDAVTRTGRSLGFPIQSENLFTTRRTIREVIESDTLAGIILTAPLSDDRHVLGLIEQRGLPCVRIAPMLDPDRGCTVIMDEYDAARAITDFLLRKGHRRVGFVRGPKIHLVSMRRYNGYANALGGPRPAHRPQPRRAGRLFASVRARAGRHAVRGEADGDLCQQR
jgi:LacI family transcriptional regulator